MTSELRFVLDTNVIVSAFLLQKSVARQAFDRAATNGKILISLGTAEELSAVLRRSSFDRYVSEALRIEFLTALIRDSILIEVSQMVRECRDPKDDKFLELAASGGASGIVTGDDDLLVLNPFRGIPIMTPRQFLEYSFK